MVKKHCERSYNIYNKTMTDRNLEKLSLRGMRIYREKYGKKLERTKKGKIIAIEVESGDGFIANTTIEAAVKAKARYPKKLFYFKRIGYPAVHSHKGFVFSAK